MSHCQLDCEHCKADGVPCLALLVTTWFQFQVAQHKHLDHQILVMCVLMPVLLLFSFYPKPVERHYASQNREILASEVSCTTKYQCEINDTE
jgi:hypothetical protein